MSNESSNNVRKITCYSWLFIALAVADVIAVAMQWFDGELSSDYILKNVSDIPENFVNAIIIVIIAFAAISALIKLFIGVKGLKEVKGTSKGGGYITLARIWLFFEIIALISEIVSMTKGDRDYLTLCDTLITTLILYDFSKSCKELREGK